MHRISFNGKFLSAAPTGVHRVAAELVTAVDQRLVLTGSDFTWRLLRPRNARRSLPLEQIKTKTVGLMTWQPWEQIDLPLASSKDLLVNLCNLGPLFHPLSVTMMHDAQVFSTPESYSKQFRLLYQTLQPKIAASAARLLTVSEFSKSELVRFGLASPDQIVVIPNGSDHILRCQPDVRILERLSLKPGCFVVALANTQRHKNIAVLLDAINSDRISSLSLVLVGKAGRAEFEQAGLFAPPGVIFAGTVSDAELRALYETSLCLAFPSTTEGFGLPPLEAMAVGCPVVAAPCGALPEVCGQAAVYAAPHVAESWVEALLRIRNDVAARQALSRAGKTQAALFTWSRSADKLIKTIEEITEHAA